MDNGEINFRRFLSGDSNGMAELVKEYSDSLVLYLNSYVDDIYIAEDIMQETFIKLVMRKTKFDPEKSSFKTWLYTIGRYTAIDYIRKNKLYKIISPDDCRASESSFDTEKELLRNERDRTLYSAMNALKREYGQVLYLTYFEGFNNTETAGIMKKSKRQTENLLYNARKALKAELERRGFVYEEL